MRHGLIAATALVVTGCLSAGSVPPARAPTTPCVPHPVNGTWRSSGVSQLGPVRSRLVLGADCSYRIGSRLVWASIREDGYYRVEDGWLVVERPTGRSRWEYRLDGDALWLGFSADATFEEWCRDGVAGCVEGSPASR